MFQCFSSWYMSWHGGPHKFGDARSRALPPTILRVWDTLIKIIAVLVRLGPAIFGLAFEVKFVTRFKGILFHISGRHTAPSKRIRRGKTGSIPTNQTLSGGRGQGSSRPHLVHAATRHQEEQYPRNNSNICCRCWWWWSAGRHEGNQSFLIFVTTRRVLVRHPVCCLCVRFVCCWLCLCV